VGQAASLPNPPKPTAEAGSFGYEAGY